MAKIRKIKEKELIGGTSNTEVYPITHARAVYDKNNTPLSDTLEFLNTEIVWDNSGTLSNMNDFVVAGVYDIKGERTRIDDNLPVLNTGGGHSFNARLTVLDSSISGSGKDDDKCITQVLSFSNRLGQGEVYIRTGKGSSLDNLTFEKWSTLQRNVNVGEVGSLDDLKDNGIYSGVWKQGRINPNYLAFVCIVINDYFIGTAPRRISQFVYGLSKFDGSVVYQSRVWDDSKDKWGDWEILNKNEISSMIKSSVDNAIKGVIADAPKAFDTLKEIADWIANDKTGAVALANAISANTRAINTEVTRAEQAEKIIDGKLDDEIKRSVAADQGLLRNIDDEARRATEAEEDIKSRAVEADSLNFQTRAETVALDYKTIEGVGDEITIPAATTESAGVMSAEDKRNLSNALKTTTEGTSMVEEQIDITDDNDKLIIRITPDGVFKENTRMTQLYGLITAGSWCKADGTITTSSTTSYTEYNVEKINNVIIKTVIRPSNGIPLYVGYKDGVKVKHYTPPTTGLSVLPISELVDCSDIDTIKVNWIISSGAQVYIPQDNTLNKINESINDSVGLFIGDSLMQGVGALIGYDAVSYVGKYLGIKTLNAGIGGTTMRKDGRDANLYEIVESYKNKDFSKPISYINSSLSGDFKDEVLSRYEVVSNTPIDIISFIFINYGANDWKVTGTVLDNDENKEDVTTVLGSLRYAVRTFIELNPYIQILVSTPGYRTAEEDTPEVNGISMGAFCDAIEKACGELHIPCWNQYRHNGVNRYNADLYLSDGTHRTAYGYAVLGKQYANFISNNLVKIKI